MEKKDKITLKNKSLKVSLNMVISKFKDDKGVLYLGTIPTISLIARSRTIENLIEIMQQMVSGYFTFYDTEEKLNKDLSRHGWIDYQTPPHMINTPPEILYNKVKTKKIVADYLLF